MEGVTVVDHPLVARHLSVLRDRTTPADVFRAALAEVSTFLGYEALRDLRVTEEDVETPLETTAGARLADEIVVVAILRAGLGMVEGFLRLVPEARVGHLGIYRDEASTEAVGYYELLPAQIPAAEVVLVDPMLATGGSAVHALTRLREAGAERIRFVCLVAAPEGVRAVQAEHPGVPIVCAMLEPRARRRRLHPAGARRRRRPPVRDVVQRHQ